MSRIILHMDMDAFYASVEVHDDPSLAGKPLIIGALPSERGVVSTCSYEARPYGVRSGMSIKEAYRLCPNGIYMHGHYHRYHEVSDQVHEILLSYTDQIEFIALDEGYLDITGSIRLFGPPEKIGLEIKKRVLNATGLTCSVGIGYNKMTAKLGSEEKKPDGFFIFDSPEHFQSITKERPVRILPGVGVKGAARLASFGIQTVGDLRSWSRQRLEKTFGEFGSDLYLHCRGYGSDHVSRLGEGEAKSIGKEVTYQRDMQDPEEMHSTLKLLASSVSDHLKRHEFYASTVTLKIKYNDLSLHTRSKTLDNPVRSSHDLYQISLALLNQAPLKKPVRLLGISGSHFTTTPIYQYSLDEDEKRIDPEKQEKVEKALDQLSARFGKGVIQTAGEMDSKRILKEKGLL
ncbi:MAG: DNA polymerase IV [Firmicutes bacterium]|nr:DNA polymerase IV [Bacillota bacterium]